jgi:hypothetical protein
MVPDHIDEYNIDQNFNWKTFPIQDEKLSILIVYDQNCLTDQNKLHLLVNKLLKVFPDKCYYDNENLKWLTLPKDTNGFKAPYLEKILSSYGNKNNLTINGIASSKHTLILDLDHSNLEDPKEFEEFPIIDENKESDPTNVRYILNDIPIIYPIFSIPDNKMRENIEITKITEGKTFITHLIAFGDYNNIKKSYYEKFDILMFTNSKIAVNFAITRTSRSFTIKNEDLVHDKIFMIDTRLMKNNMCFYQL